VLPTLVLGPCVSTCDVRAAVVFTAHNNMLVTLTVCCMYVLMCMPKFSVLCILCVQQITVAVIMCDMNYTVKLTRGQRSRWSCTVQLNQDGDTVFSSAKDKIGMSVLHVCTQVNVDFSGSK
jgi:hypothetical protein